MYVTNIFRYQEDGVTNPIHCKLSNGDYAIVKYMNNPCGQQALINEFVCCQIAAKYQLSMPQSGICIIDGNAQINDEVLQCRTPFSQCNFGYSFYSTYIRFSVPPVPSLFQKANKDQLTRLIVFDHVIYNKDRHDGNLLLVVQGGESFLYAIDHSHVFKNTTRWDCDAFKEDIQGNDYNDSFIMKCNNEIYRAIFDYSSPSEDDFCNACNFAKAELTPDFLHSIMELIPSLWISNLEHYSSALEEYLNYRIANLDHIKRVILKEGGLNRE